jgi:hypothetical protein
MKASRTARAVAVLVIALIALLSIAAVAAASRNQAVAAQAATATPAAEEAVDAGAFIAISPQAGFPLDPFLVSLQGGGPVDASTVSDACSGFVAEAPAVTVDYQGEADLLRAFFLSNGDTTWSSRRPMAISCATTTPIRCCSTPASSSRPPSKACTASGWAAWQPRT